ncbi:ATP-binding cassette domain-containing protein [Paenalcaligenes niemegkensis]|nr:ATP-binding cassette domain-containing protein [Paenalcaligenes niemegkensis]MCQ9616384.1 ATP-binding cassette domain-containing protein [Paenalcaligenes niemegkensis]
MQVIHGINLQIGPEPVVMLGRNGAGKSTLCAALLGLLPAQKGAFSLNGIALTHKKVHEIAQSGLALVPQGRRVFPSLTVHEHLQLFKGKASDLWTTDRIYATFPRLAQRRHNYGNQLSGVNSKCWRSAVP